jgi:multiple sugar transport system permease protein
VAAVSAAGQAAARLVGGTGSVRVLSPWLIAFAVFTAAPMTISLYLSFTAYNGINSPHSVGMSNYQRLFSDPKVTLALRNTRPSRPAPMGR